MIEADAGCRLRSWESKPRAANRTTEAPGSSFINFPATNLAVPAVLTVKSNPVFKGAESKYFPSKPDTRASVSGVVQGRLTLHCGLGAVTKLIFPENKEACLRTESPLRMALYPERAF